MIQARVENVATRSTVVVSNWYCRRLYLACPGLGESESWTVDSAGNFSVSYSGYCRANWTVLYCIIILLRAPGQVTGLETGQLCPFRNFEFLRIGAA